MPAKALATALLAVISGAGTFVGLWLCSLLGLDFGFGDLKRELAKCLTLSVVIVLIGEGLYWVAPDPRVLLILPVIWAIGIRLAWLDLEKVEILITGISTLLFTAVVVYLLIAALSP